jgi:hypothetical protein
MVNFDDVIHVERYGALAITVSYVNREKPHIDPFRSGFRRWLCAGFAS